jgi:hypothetical protein
MTQSGSKIAASFLSLAMASVAALGVAVAQTVTPAPADKPAAASAKPAAQTAAAKPSATPTNSNAAAPAAKPAVAAAQPAAKPAYTTASVTAAPKPADTAAKPAAATAGKRQPKITDTANSCAINPAKPYFVEFRARMAVSYGHAFVVFGRLTPGGRIERADVAGLHPAGDDPSSWLAGHIVPVKSETGPSLGDLEEKYVSARYCVNLSEAEYKKTYAYIRQKQKDSPTWYANTNNCVAFIKDIAQSMGLKTPVNVISYPEVFVNNVREMNGSSQMATTAIPYAQWGMEAPKETAKINDGLHRAGGKPRETAKVEASPAR